MGIGFSLLSGSRKESHPVDNVVSVTFDSKNLKLLFY